MHAHKKKYSNIFKTAIATLLVAFIAGLSACDDDPIVTPTGSDDDDDCTGSYCKLEMNKPQKAVAYNKLVQNPAIF